MTDHATFDDAHLTDHEWRLKMAAEGKALYLPGKTVEEMLAEDEKRKADAMVKHHRVQLDFNRDELERMTAAANGAEIYLWEAACAFELLAQGINKGAFSGSDSRLGVTLDLLGMALRQRSETAGEELSKLGRKLKDAPRESLDISPKSKKEAAK
jgi:hypothetical protein